MRLTKVHWTALLAGLPAGEYTLRSRTIDAKGNAQPMPRPFQKSGHAAIESVDITVKSAERLPGTVFTDHVICRKFFICFRRAIKLTLCVPKMVGFCHRRLVSNSLEDVPE
jgi:hypothetical protein